MFFQAMSSQSVADRRRQVLVGELPPDFLRLIVPREQEATSFPQQQVGHVNVFKLLFSHSAQQSFVEGHPLAVF
ncbi:hypothetical protein ANCCAN_26890 [Ancylostoma caninum]|uniref:Uncharacterized protein n=1 Tax=Ancylostoma caninum TaxID=29170 RepID=A0A368F934_ANCCA|nr:hypothetical protein ANCCAN_26890 [Ancylostoma caninum]